MKISNKKILLCLLSMFILLSVTGCRQDDMEDIDIIVTNYPNEYIVSQLYGKHSNISSIYPDGVDIDNYKITNKRKKDISKKALFVYTGLIEKERKIAVDLLDINGGLKIIDTSYVLETQNSIEELWLNLSYLLMMAKNVELGLNEYISSSYLKKEIKENYEKLKVSLSELDADYRLSIENAKKKTLIVNNNNLKYLEKFGLTVIVLDDDAMDKTYNDVKTLIDSGQINYIYKFKDDKNSTRIESLITEYPNLKITELHKIDNITDKERDDKEDYISLMNKNLELIKQELYQ